MDEMRAPRWVRRAPRFRGRRKQVFTATALAAMFAATACGDAGVTLRDGLGVDLTTSTTTTDESTPTTGPDETTTTTAAEESPTSTTNPQRSTTSTSTTSSTAPSTTSTTYRRLPYCETHPDGTQSCVVEGRPLWRRLRRTLLLPAGSRFADDADARSEYASVASFGELSLRLIAVGAPAELVEACHRAALDEIRHARVTDELAARQRSRFGAIPGLLGRRIGGWRLTRRMQLQALAVESFTDGWLNEGAAACRLRQRAQAAQSLEAQAALSAMAADEQRHADLARRIVTWCFEEDPEAVGAALARLPVAA